MTSAVKNLLRPEVVVVCDADGVLVVYEMGEHHHCVVPNSEWLEYVKTNRPYDTARPIAQMQKFIADKGADNVYVCTVILSEEEKGQKKDFIMREYGIPEDHIIFVSKASEKAARLLELQSELSKTRDNLQMAMIEDTVSTIDYLYENTDFFTVHISSFFDYIDCSWAVPRTKPRIRNLRRD